MHFEAHIREALGKALCELGHHRGLIEVMPSSVCQLSEPGDVMIDIPIFHLEFAEFLVGVFVFGIVNKRLLELLLDILPFVHAGGDLTAVDFHFVEPVIHFVGPSFGVRAFNKR
jgi:hypothetical protein